MPGWAELASYRELTALLCGALTALSFWAVGHLLCGRQLARLDPAVRTATECVAGVLAISLLVQALAMAQASRPAVMQALWSVALLVTAIALFLAWRRRGAAAAPLFRASAAPLWPWLPALLMAAALLLAGAAPETRADELGYHTLATGRLLSDGGLRFHPLPWEADVVPQLVWHYALVPLYAVAGSAAGGVASASLALVLAFSTARLVAWQSGSAALAAAAAFIALACGYSIVFFTTTGPHAFGYLAVFVAVAAVGWSQELRAAAGAPAWALAVAIGCAGAVAGKATMLPLMALVTGLAAWDVQQETRAARVRLALIAQLVLIPVLVLAPLFFWTWAASGSPLGVLTAGLAPRGAFDPQTLAAYRGTRALFENHLQWRFESAYWSLSMLLLGLAALVFEPSRARRRRWWLIAVLQSLVILALLPWEIRHLGGIQYPLLAAGMMALAARWRARGWADGSFAALAGLAATPWAVFVLWIASIYVPLAGGRETAAQFVRRYAGLQADFEALDRRLPADARILIGRSRSDAVQYAWYARPPIWYAPRPVLFDTAEVQRGDRVYLMYVGAGGGGEHGPIPLDPWLPPGYALGRSVYVDPDARFYPSRTPRGNPGLARLEVFELTPQP